MATKLDELKEEHIAWIRTEASAEYILSRPAHTFKRPGSRRTQASPKKVANPMSPAEAKMVREALAGLTLDSPPFLKARQKLCDKYHWKPRQIGAALRKGRGPRQVQPKAAKEAAAPEVPAAVVVRSHHKKK